MQLRWEQPLHIWPRREVRKGAFARLEARGVGLDAAVEEVRVCLAAVDVLAVALVLVVDALGARGVVGRGPLRVEGSFVDLAAGEEEVVDVAGLGGG